MENTDVIKPDVILKLERLYNIKLSVFNAPENFDEGTGNIEMSKRTYHVNSAGKLTALSLNSCGIKDVSPIVGELQDLQYLSLTRNLVTDLSPLSSLINLRVLFLGANNISSLRAIEFLSNLKVLAIWENPIRDISVIKGYNLLERFFCQNTGIDDISSVSGLSRLRELVLSNNSVFDISALEGLSELTKLNVGANLIKKIPKKVAQNLNWFEHLGKHIVLRGNPLQYPPNSVIDLGPETVRNYYETAEQLGHAPLSEGRIIVVGDGGSGKSSLIEQVLYGTFDIGRTQTNGIKIENWNLKREDGRELTLHFWDFGGQEIQHAVHKFFFTSGCLYVLVLDNRKEEEPEYWLQQIESLGGNAPVIVVFNKHDENVIEIADRKYLKDKYPNIMGFFDTSCKSSFGLEKLKGRLIELASDLQTVEEQFPNNWFKIKKCIEDCTSGAQHYIDYSAYTQICKRNNAESEDIQKLLLRYFTTIGSVTWFGDTYLNYLHVLSPAWITQGVYKIITSDMTIEKFGKINVAYFNQLLKPLSENDYQYDQAHYGYILSMMKKFDLCYSPDDKDILIPSAFGKTPKVEYRDFRGEEVRTYILQFKEYMPLALIHRFIAKELPRVHGNNYWYSGIVIKDPKSGSLAMVQADKEAKRIYVRIKGDAPLGMWEHIRRELDDIASSYAKITYDELVLLDYQADSTVSYEDLIGYIKAEKSVYFHPKLQKDYNVGYLIGLFESKENTIEKFRDISFLTEDYLHERTGKTLPFVIQILNNNSPQISAQVNTQVNIDIDIQVVNKISTDVIGDATYLLAELNGANKELKEALELVVKFAEDAQAASNSSEVKKKGWGRKLKNVFGVLSTAGDQLKKIADGGEAMKTIFNGVKELAVKFDLKEVVEYLKSLV